MRTVQRATSQSTRDLNSSSTLTLRDSLLPSLPTTSNGVSLSVNLLTYLLTYSLCAPPLSVWPHLFRGAGHEKRRGEQLKWSLAFRLYIGSFPGPVHTARLGQVFFCVFSLGLCFLCFLICLYVPILLCFPEQLIHLPYSFLVPA